ncbi:hypothetical protein TNCV_1737761 [Trichonephila clavipes]|nr:hypothetical protein TNCV_1737761 [Trichonephila clavipes]
MENVRRRIDIRLCSTEEQARKLIAKSNFNRRTIFSENLMAVHLKKTQIKFFKPIQKKNNSTRPLSSKIKANAGEKQLNSSVGTKQLNSTGENNSTRQHEQNNSTQLSNRNEQLNSAAGTKQLNSLVGTKQLNSSVGTKQLNSALPSTAYDRLQPPTTAYNRLQPPTTAYNRLQPPAPPVPPLQQNRLFLPTYIYFFAFSQNV